MDTNNLGFDTKLIHAGDFHDEKGSAVIPIYQTSTFSFKNADHGADLFSGKEKGYIYTRIGNPTIEALENKLAALENGKYGIATASGMAAINTVYMAFLGAGKHVVSTGAIYGPSRTVVEKHWKRFGVEYTYLDTSDAEAVEKAIKPDTSLLYIETPANPTMAITNIRKMSEIARKNNIPLAVDNTFCSPFLQKPLDLGADIVVHSLTKFINGHADVVGGAVITKDAEFDKMLRPVMISMGGNMDPHQAYLVVRGVKTLSLRIEKAQENAVKMAEFLEKHPKVAWINFPGLPCHPQYQLAKEQMKGPGCMISFGLKDGFDGGKRLMNNVKIALLAVSLGGVESLIQHPASMTHAGVSKAEKNEVGITDDLVRYSVGIENVEDLIADMEQALDKV